MFGIPKGERLTYEQILSRTEALSKLLKHDRNAAIRQQMKAMFGGTNEGIIEVEGLDSVKWAMAEKRLNQHIQEIEDVWALLVGDELKAEVLAKHMSNHFQGKLGDMANGIYKDLLTYGKKTEDSGEIRSIRKAQQMIIDYIKLDNPEEFNLADPELAAKCVSAVKKLYKNTHPDGLIPRYKIDVHDVKLKEINMKYDNQIQALKGLDESSMLKQKGLLEGKRASEIKALEGEYKAKVEEVNRNFQEIEYGLNRLKEKAQAVLYNRAFKIFFEVCFLFCPGSRGCYPVVVLSFDFTFFNI